MIKYNLFTITVLSISVYVDYFMTHHLDWITLMDCFLIGASSIIIMDDINQHYKDKIKQFK